MPTRPEVFRHLTAAEQLALVWGEGEYLARRWEKNTEVLLYHMPADFFAEVYYDNQGYRLVRIDTFTKPEPLALYAAYVRLPPLT